MKKNCVICKENELTNVKIGDIEVGYCEKCHGYWFEAGELRKVKDEKLENAKWLDFDLWKDFSHLKAIESSKRCPKDNVNLYTLNYSDSDIKIDACKECHGIWVDKGEFEKIINYIKDKSDSEILHNYAINYLKELEEVFTGPEGFRSELNDFLVVASMFKYKFLAQHPELSEFLLNLPH